MRVSVAAGVRVSTRTSLARAWRALVEVHMKKREARRDRTYRKGARRRRDHLARIHPTGQIDCICEQSIWWFAKRKGLGCDKCRGRQFGNPKVACGMCKYADKWRPAVIERITGRRLAKRWLVAQCLEDVEI